MTTAGTGSTAARRAAPERPSGILIACTVAAFISCAGLGTGLLGYATGQIAVAIASTIALIGALGTVVSLCLALDAKSSPRTSTLRICSAVTIVAGAAALTLFLIFAPFDFVVPIAIGISIAAQVLILVASFTHNI